MIPQFSFRRVECPKGSVSGGGSASRRLQLTMSLLLLAQAGVLPLSSQAAPSLSRQVSTESAAMRWTLVESRSADMISHERDSMEASQERCRVNARYRGGDPEPCADVYFFLSAKMNPELFWAHEAFEKLIRLAASSSERDRLVETLVASGLSPQALEQTMLLAGASDQRIKEIWEERSPTMEERGALIAAAVKASSREEVEKHLRRSEFGKISSLAGRDRGALGSLEDALEGSPGDMVSAAALEILKADLSPEDWVALREGLLRILKDSQRVMVGKILPGD